MKSGLTKVFPIGILIIALLPSCQKNIHERGDSLNESQPTAKPTKELKDFEQINLVGDNSDFNPAQINGNFINGWGISFPPSGPVWVSSQGGGLSLVLSEDGIPAAISPVHIPGAGLSETGHPTGQVFNGTPGFRLPNGNPARFIFAGDDGAISGWNGGPSAFKEIDDSPDAAYFGITIAADGADSFLYVANFSESKIDVYDTAWQEVSMPFSDPELPSDYSPFNIQNIGNKLFVLYAKKGPDGDEVHHPGFGIIDIFNPDGSLERRFVSNGQLNAPWGIAKAPKEFWSDGTDLQDVILVGNFGDGHINAFNAEGNFLGQLRSHGNPIVIDGLWGIAFAPETSIVINHDRLYFAAGPGDERHGLFGFIEKRNEPQTPKISLKDNDMIFNWGRLEML